MCTLKLMQKSTNELATFLGSLRRQARAQGLSDAQWAKHAGVRHETLSRLKHRDTCDLRTLQALAAVVGAQVDVRWDFAGARAGVGVGSGGQGGHFPAVLTRDDEERLATLCASCERSAAAWLRHGNGFFMAGVAMVLASLRGFDRRAYCALAEQLHPGSSQPGVFALWLAGSPLRPSRFVPMLRNEAARAA